MNLTLQPEAAPLSPAPGTSGEGRDDGSSTGEAVRYKSVTRVVECGSEGKRMTKRILVTLDCPVDSKEPDQATQMTRGPA
ncbi:integrase [Lasius niger]|uniref:Integrase n=1 Tax=Lasius niger TaxID=67767 RepID=A0A0J7KN84_LASNI|nr:integrase [Lasius niger]